MVSWDGKVDNFASSFFFFSFFIYLFFLLNIIRSGHLAEIRLSVCMSKSHRSLCVPFSRTGAGLCIYHLLVWSNLNSLHITQLITLPTQSCLVLYSFCANLLHIIIIIIIIIILLIWAFFVPVLAEGFLLESEWQQVSSSVQALLSFLTDLNNAVAWMVSSHPHISKSSSPCTFPDGHI